MASEVEKLETTTIRISHDTKKRLDILGAKNDTYEDIVNRLVDSYLEKQKAK